MASTEALDQVVEQTSNLDISKPNGLTKDANQNGSSSEQNSQESVNSQQEPKEAANGKERAAHSKESSPKPQQDEGNTPPAPVTTVKSLPKAFRDNFRLFSKFGDTKSDGKSLTLSQSDKWMKQAKVIDGKKLTTTDTGICFKKFKWV